MAIGRRQLLSLGFLREKKRPRDEPATDPSPGDFSLDIFYRRRAESGVASEALPPIAVRVVPADVEMNDD